MRWNRSLETTPWFWLTHSLWRYHDFTHKSFTNESENIGSHLIVHWNLHVSITVLPVFTDCGCWWFPGLKLQSICNNKQSNYDSMRHLLSANITVRQRATPGDTGGTGYYFKRAQLKLNRGTIIIIREISTLFFWMHRMKRWYVYAAGSQWGMGNFQILVQIWYLKTMCGPLISGTCLIQKPTF